MASQEDIPGQGPIKSAWKIIPTFQARDVATVIQFYVKELGFHLGGLYNHDAEDPGEDGDQPPADQATFCSISAGKKSAANMYFFKVKAGEDFRPSSVMIAVGTEQIDELHDRISSLGTGKVSIVDPIGDRPWGYRQFSILDPDGNRITFFRFLEGGNPGSE